MRTQVFSLRIVLIMALALSVVMLTVGCFGGEEPAPTPAPTATPEPTATATATATPEPTPPPPAPVMPPMPPRRQANQPVAAQPIPTITVKLITPESPTAVPTVEPDTESPTPTPDARPEPTATSVPEVSPTPVPTATALPEPEATSTSVPIPTATQIPTVVPSPTEVPTSTPEPIIPPTSTPVPEPTVIPTPEGPDAMAILDRALIGLVELPGYTQWMTLTYHVIVGDDKGPRRRDVTMVVDHIKPDLMEGRYAVTGLTDGRDFTSVGDSIYTPVEDGYHVPTTMPMRLRPRDALLCNLILCKWPEDIIEARVTQQTTDDEGAEVYEIVATYDTYNGLGHPHVQHDPGNTTEVTFIVGVDDGKVREVSFEGVDLYLGHFFGPGDHLAGLDFIDYNAIRLDMSAQVFDLDPGTHINIPKIKPGSEAPPEIASVDFYAGSFTSEPSDLTECTAQKCGAVKVTFTEPVLVHGRVKISVAHKGYLECGWGCSSKEPSDTMIFFGYAWEAGTSLWIKPGDRVAGQSIFQNAGSIITDEYGVELVDYHFDSRVVARPSEHPPVDPSTE